MHANAMTDVRSPHWKKSHLSTYILLLIFLTIVLNNANAIVEPSDALLKTFENDIFSDFNGDHCFSQCFSVHHEELNQSDQLVLMAHCPAESAIKASSRPMQLELLLPQYS